MYCMWGKQYDWRKCVGKCLESASVEEDSNSGVCNSDIVRDRRPTLEHRRLFHVLLQGLPNSAVAIVRRRRLHSIDYRCRHIRHQQSTGCWLVNPYYHHPFYIVELSYSLIIAEEMKVPQTESDVENSSQAGYSMYLGIGAIILLAIDTVVGCCMVQTAKVSPI